MTNTAHSARLSELAHHSRDARDLTAAGLVDSPWSLRWGGLLGGMLVALAGCALALVLAAQSWGASDLIGCGDAGCADAARLRWSKWLGLPVALPAAVLFAAVLAAIPVSAFWPTASLRRIAMSAMLAASVIFAGAAVWFISLLLLQTEQLCKYCVLTHLLGLTLAGFIWIRHARACRDRQRCAAPTARQSLHACVFGLVVLGVLIIGQMLGPHGAAASSSTGFALAAPAPSAAAAPVPFDQGQGADRRITPLGTTIAFAPHQMPMLGSPDAKHVLVLFFDYTCEGCQKLHRFLEAIVARYPEQLAIALAPTPIAGSCNPLPGHQDATGSHRYACQYARLALALWRADPTKFNAFDSWMIGSSSLPPMDFALENAIQWVGRERLQEALADPAIEQRIQDNFQFPRHVAAIGGTWTLPHLATPVQDIDGCPDTQQQLLDILDSMLHLTDEGGSP